jgi:hypothetical protein
MPRLSDLPELIGFFSYSREDDEDFDHALSKLRTRIQNELRGQLGRSRETLRLWQDREAIPPGTLWAAEIQAAIDQSVFFIPIVSPRVVRSDYCVTEFTEFLARERQLGRRDLVFPVLFINVPELADETRQREHAVLEVIAQRQYVDWREFRYDPDSPTVRREVAEFCAKIVTALQRTPPQEEKEKRQADAAEQARRRQAEDEARREQERAQEAEARQRAEAEARQRAEAVARSRRDAEDERRAKAGEVPTPDEPPATPPTPSGSAAARGVPHGSLPQGQSSRAVGAMLLLAGSINFVLTTAFVVRLASQNSGHASVSFVMVVLGLLLLDASSFGVGLGTIWGKPWSGPAGLAISVLGLGNSLFFLYMLGGMEEDGAHGRTLVGVPYGVSSIVYIAGLVHFLAQLRRSRAVA